MSLPSLTQVVARLRRLRPSQMAAIVVLILGAVLAPPLFANQSGWVWKDLSGILPYRDGVRIDLLSANGGSWLVSDNERLYRVNGETMNDLTGAVRSKGISTVSTLSSDEQRWLVGGRALDASAPRAFLTDGNSWTDVSNVFAGGRAGFDAVGYRGTWYGRTFSTATQYEPSRWMAFSFNPTTLEKNVFPITSGLNNMAPGCMKEVTDVRVCIGETRIVRAGGNWFMIGGNAEVANGQGQTTQFAKGNIWNINGANLNLVPNLPAFRFVSGVWQGNNRVLIATSDAVSNPFNADHYWMFDGTSLRDVSSEALKVGLLSNDAREVRAADAGETWMITIGKQLIRFDGELMSDAGKSRDFFTSVSANGQGVYLLGGAVSTPDQAFATQPLTAKLVEVREDLTAPRDPATEIVSRLRGPRITVVAIPRDNVVGDGKVYTIRVTAQDTDGVANTNILVNGAKLKACQTNVCEYTQTYYTNGQPTRTIEFMGSATDKQGFTNTSKTVTLTIDRASQTGATNDKLGQKDATGQTITIPNNRNWNRNEASGLAWMVWRQPEQSVLKDNEQTTLVFAAQGTKGLGRVNVMVNGEAARSCDFTSQTDIRVCTVTLTGSDYPAATEIFANAQIFNVQNREDQSVWTEGVRIQRAADATTITTDGQTVRAAVNERPVFMTTLAIEPNQPSVRRGDTFTVKTKSQNSGYGLMTVEIYQNDKVIRTCSVGTVVSPVACEAKIDTTTMAAGTTVSYVTRAIDTKLNVLWSNTRAITIRDVTVQPQPLNAQGPIKVWNWMGSEVSEILNWETTYSVGAWSPNGIKQIEMIVDGQVRRTCSFGLTTGNRECDVALSSNDYAHKQSISVNARVTDGKGNKAWSDVRSILMKRFWENSDGAVYIPAYASISTNDETGYTPGERITFKAKGWSPSNVDRVQIFLNGEMVANCPSAVCEYTSAPITTDQIEYQARSIDLAGRSAWTGMIGMSKK
ncbi:hypothetical protein KBD34_02690 [Patescibacteria group bacterium]|nr:hypothetical protein [Patescibacteria group bacterium]